MLVHGWVTNAELLWEYPPIARLLERLGSFCRVINFDKRGTGLSDRVPVDRLPTLEERMDDVRGARWMAEQIPGARLIELPGVDHLIWSDPGPVFDVVEEFVTGVPPATVPDRMLVTVLFTDIVGSTERAAAVGDDAWRRLLDRHDELLRRYLQRYQGREIKSTGDGFLAVFDGPARAVRCAQAFAEAVAALGLEVRAGVHTGEVEARADDIGGVAVHVGARIAALAVPGEVLVSRTVKDLVAGSGIDLEPRGEHELRGVPGSWELFLAG